MTGFESVVGINPWTALFTFCNLIITFLILKKFLFKPVKKMIDDRQREVDDIYAEAKRARAEAQELKNQRKAQLKDTARECNELIQAATDRALEKEQKIISEAAQQAAFMKDKAQQDIALERKKAMNEAKNELSGIAVEIASRVVEKELTAADHDALAQDFIEKLGERS